jgi:hypothetical protein
MEGGECQNYSLVEKLLLTSVAWLTLSKLSVKSPCLHPVFWACFHPLSPLFSSTSGYPVNCFNQLITHARSQDLDSRPQREVSGPGSQDLCFRPSTRGFRTWISGPGFRALNARFQDLDLKTWVSGPQREVSGPRREVSGPGYQDLGFRPSVFGSQDQGFRSSKALHPTVVLSFSRHFSLRPPSLFSASSGHRQTDARTDVVNLYIRSAKVMKCY